MRRAGLLPSHDLCYPAAIVPTSGWACRLSPIIWSLVKPARRSATHDEGRTLGQVFQLSRAHIRASAAKATCDLLQRAFDGTLVGNDDFVTFASPIVLPATGVLVHRGLARHAVELHTDASAVLVHPFALAFVVTSEHCAEHHKVCSCREGP